MQALPGTLSCGCCDCRYGHDRWALRTRLTCSIRLRISAGTHMRTENVAAFEKNCFFLLKVLQSEYTEYKGRKAPMPRPPRCRQICGVPQVDTFCPNGCENTEPILLTLDEYEVIRLVDLEQQTHEQCAAQMDISALPCRRFTKAHGARSQRVLSTGNRCTSPGETTASAEDRRQLTAAVAAGCREPTWKNQAKLAKEILL